MSLSDKADDFQKGSTAFYYDSGYVFKVEIIKSFCNEEWEGYRLRIVELVSGLQNSYPQIPEVFDCYKLRNVYCSGLWRIKKNFSF